MKTIKTALVANSKRFILALVLISAFSVQASAQRFVYVDMEYILENLPEYTKAQQQLDQMRVIARQKVANFFWQKPANEMLTMFYHVLAVDTSTANMPTKSLHTAAALKKELDRTTAANQQFANAAFQQATNDQLINTTILGKNKSAFFSKT